MRRVDVLIAAVLAVAVAGSVVSVVTWEEPRDARPTFDVAWQTVLDRTAAPGGSRVGPGAVTTSFDLDDLNLTQVRVLVDATAQGTRFRAVRVDVVVTPPRLEARSASTEIPGPGAADARTVSVAVELSPVPPPATVVAANASAALAEMARRFTTDAGRGTWQVAVTFGDAGPLPPEEYRVRVTAESLAYEARVSLRVPGGR